MDVPKAGDPYRERLLKPSHGHNPNSKTAFPPFDWE